MRHGHLTDLVFHQAVYNSCDEEFDRSGGKSITWLLLEHALARLYQVRDGMRVPDVLLVVVPSDSARLPSILEQFVERFASRSLREAATSDWLYVVESTPSGQSCSCEGHKFMSVGCQTEVVPEALIFPTELLRRARAPDFEAATGLQRGSDPQDPLMLLMAILMDMGGVDVIHERLPYEPGSKDDPGLSDAVRAYESFQGIDHFSWDHLEGRVACLQHGGFFYLFDWKPPETLAELIVCIHGFGPALDVLPPGCRCSDTDAGFVKCCSKAAQHQAIDSQIPSVPVSTQETSCLHLPLVCLLCRCGPASHLRMTRCERTSVARVTVVIQVYMSLHCHFCIVGGVDPSPDSEIGRQASGPHMIPEVRWRRLNHSFKYADVSELGFSGVLALFLTLWAFRIFLHFLDVSGFSTFRVQTFS